MHKTLPFILLLLSLDLNAQEIKKVNAAVLQQLIQESDHPLVIAFWATWCAPCLHEIPWLQEAIKKDTSGRTELLLVSLDLPPSFPGKLKNFIARKGYQASFYWFDVSASPELLPLIAPAWKGGIPASLWINNQKGYQLFIERQLTPLQAIREVEKLVK